MSKISRIRILNLNYNNNTIKIDDETFDLGGQNTLISLRNGGGKSVLVQMIVSLFVNRTYRDFGDRPFKSYFTTNRPTFLMTEWILDNGIDRFLAGMMVRKTRRKIMTRKSWKCTHLPGAIRMAVNMTLTIFQSFDRTEIKRS